MNLHFVLGFVEDTRRRPEVCADILTAVAEENIAGEALLARFQRTNGALCEEIQSNAFGSARVTNDVR